MRLAQHRLRVTTNGPGLYEITAEVVSWAQAQRVERGLLTVFLPHTSASLLIQENADADVRADLQRFFDRLVPEDARRYQHQAEGADDMPAHIKSALTQVQLAIPIEGRAARPRHLARDLSLRAPARAAFARGEPYPDRRLTEIAGDRGPVLYFRAQGRRQP